MVPESSGRHPAVRVVEGQKLRSPHLVLADFSRDIRIAFIFGDEMREALQRVLRLDDLVAVFL